MKGCGDAVIAVAVGGKMNSPIHNKVHHEEDDIVVVVVVVVLVRLFFMTIVVIISIHFCFVKL
jgi:hypothetical protein